MKLTVGSTNPTKINSVQQAIAEVPLFAGAEVVGVDVQVPEFGHPNTLEATTEGAMNRARQAFVDCDFSFGIEGGLTPAPLTRTGYWEVSVVCDLRWYRNVFWFIFWCRVAQKSFGFNFTRSRW